MLKPHVPSEGLNMNDLQMTFTHCSDLFCRESPVHREVHPLSNGYGAAIEVDLIRTSS